MNLVCGEPAGYFQPIFNEELKLCVSFTKEMFISPISEAVTKEQKEKGQREMLSNNLDPFKKIRLELLDEHNNIDKIKDVKEKIKKIKEINAKFLAFNKLANLMKKLPIKQENPARVAFKNNTKIKSKRIKCVNSINGTGVSIMDYKGEKIPYLLIDTVSGLGNSVNGIVFDIPDEEIAKKISSFILLHEIGHIYEFLKERIEKGAASLIDTLNEKDREKVVDSEGKATAYAFYNMYIKNRRELLKKKNVGC